MDDDLYEEVVRMLATFSDVFPSQMQVSERTVNTWVEVLTSEKVTPNEIREVIPLLAKREKFWPTPAVFFERLETVREERRCQSQVYHAEREPTAEEWAEFRRQFNAARARYEKKHGPLKSFGSFARRPDIPFENDRRPNDEEREP